MTNLPQSASFYGLKLARYPAHIDNLQAWNAADELLIEQLRANASPGQKIALFNDDFGALGCALADYALDWYSDSWIAHQALKANIARNQLSAPTCYDSMTSPQPADLWVVKVPKNLALLEHQLALISQMATPEQPIILAAMLKFLPKRVFEIVEHYLGELTTSLARKKARLIFSHARQGAHPSRYPLHWQASPYPWQLSDAANVFCLGKLDIGSRFLLDNLPEGDFNTIIDLGCGNGLLSLGALKRWPEAQIIACDESLMAVASAQRNLLSNYPQCASQIDCRADNSLEQQPDGKADLILCNPPFHQQQTISTHIAKSMFYDARRCLKPGGQLCVVANRHLPYQPLLKKLFAQVKVLASNPKFVILVARKSNKREK